MPTGGIWELRSRCVTRLPILIVLISLHLVQLIDDLLDFLPPSPTLGKPSLGADLSLGLTTAPVLYAWRTNPALGPLIARKYAKEGDVQYVRDLVGKSDGLEKTRELAERFAREARRAVEQGLPESEAREELVALTRKVIERVA